MLKTVCHLVVGQCESRLRCLQVHIGIKFAYGHLRNNSLCSSFQAFRDFDMIQGNLVI